MMTFVEQGKALLRIADDLRQFLEGSFDPDAVTMLEDVKTLEDVGRWLVGTPAIGEPRVRTAP